MRGKYQLALETIIALCADAFIGSVMSSTVEGVLQKLKGDPTKIAYQQALTTAIQRYSSSGQRALLATALVKDGSILTEQGVANELAQLIKFERSPDAKLIGIRWRDAADMPSSSLIDFTEEANLFIDLLRNALQESDVYRPVFELQNLNAIAESSVTSTEHLRQIQNQLHDMMLLMESQLGNYLKIVVGSTPNIKTQIRDFTRLIEDKTRDFVGRQFVFDAIQKFVAENPRGYFFVRGEPGIGKTALAAQMIRNSGYVHHFNVRTEGINKPSDFLRNICAQLIAVYDLPHDHLPHEAGQDAGFLNKILNEVAIGLGDKKCIIVVDALDEVDGEKQPRGANLLFLPESLPKGVYIVATLRKIPLSLRIDCEQGTLDLEQDSSGNLADVQAFVSKAIQRPSIARYVEQLQIGHDEFVSVMVSKSEGNFIYLRYVLNDIEKGEYNSSDIKQLPQGLRQYYEKHWEYMKGRDQDAWFDYKLPVLVALAVMPEAISIELICDFSKIQSKSRVRHVLKEWSQFLDEESAFEKAEAKSKYRLYHASFYDFISSRQEIEDEMVDLRGMKKQVGEDLYGSLFTGE
ncbi:MAG: hypothetical protein AAFU33_24190 [Bacteroidota bacterium]